MNCAKLYNLRREPCCFCFSNIPTIMEMKQYADSNTITIRPPSPLANPFKSRSKPLASPTR